MVANRYKEIIPAQTLKGKELQQLNSYSVADAIRFFPGAQIKDYGGIGGIKTVNIRSMGTTIWGFLQWHSAGERTKRTDRLR